MCWISRAVGRTVLPCPICPPELTNPGTTPYTLELFPLTIYSPEPLEDEPLDVAVPEGGEYEYADAA